MDSRLHFIKSAWQLLLRNVSSVHSWKLVSNICTEFSVNRLLIVLKEHTYRISNYKTLDMTCIWYIHVYRHTLTLLHWWLTLHVWWTLFTHLSGSRRRWSWCRALGSPSMLWLCLLWRLWLVWWWDSRVTTMMWMMYSPQRGCTWWTSPSSLLLGKTSTWYMEANVWPCNTWQRSIMYLHYLRQRGINLEITVT